MINVNKIIKYLPILILIIIYSICGCIQEKNIPPEISINAQPLQGEIPLTIYFKAESNDIDGEIINYFWNFGDGNTSTLKNPTHTYQKYGIMNVTCEVIDNNGDLNSDNIIIKVYEPYNQDDELYNWLDLFLAYTLKVFSNITNSIEQSDKYIEFLENAAEMFEDADKEIRHFTLLSEDYYKLRNETEIFIDYMVESLNYRILQLNEYLKYPFYDEDLYYEYKDNFESSIDTANIQLDLIINLFIKID